MDGGSEVGDEEAAGGDGNVNLEGLEEEGCGDVSGNVVWAAIVARGCEGR